MTSELTREGVKLDLEASMNEKTHISLLDERVAVARQDLQHGWQVMANLQVPAEGYPPAILAAWTALGSVMASTLAGKLHGANDVRIQSTPYGSGQVIVRRSTPEELIEAVISDEFNKRYIAEHKAKQDAKIAAEQAKLLTPADLA